MTCRTFSAFIARITPYAKSGAVRLISVRSIYSFPVSPQIALWNSTSSFTLALGAASSERSTRSRICVNFACAACVKLARARRIASASKNQAHAVDFLQIFVFQVDNEHTAPGVIDNQPLLLELLQSLANGSAAHLQFPRQLALVDAISRLHPARKDRIGDDFYDVVL